MIQGVIINSLLMFLIKTKVRPKSCHFSLFITPHSIKLIPSPENTS